MAEIPANSAVKLTKSQKEMVRLTAIALIDNSKVHQVAEALGISRQALNVRLSKFPQIMDAVEKMRKLTVDLARSRILKSSEDGADRLISLIDANSENVQLQASIEILDRAGIVKPQTQNNIQVNVLNQIRKDKEEFDL